MSLKSWGLELWDQIDRVFLYSNQGLEQIELYYRTISDIHKIYLSLVKKHKAIVVPNSTKSKLVLENSTYCSGFNKFLNCMNDQAAIYESQAEEIRDSVVAPIKGFIDKLKNTIITQSNEYAKFKNTLENHKRTLDRAWAKYYQAFVNKKRSEANYHKIKDDKTVPRLDIERVQAIANGKTAEFERMRGEYASQLQNFNNARSLLFLQDLPKLCSELEMFDRQRAEITTETGLALVSIQKKHLEKTGTCNASMGDALQIVDFRADSTALLAACRSGISFPPDIVFVDLDKSKGDSFSFTDFPGILQQGGKVEKNDSAKSLFGGAGMRGIDPKDMLPEQVKVRLDDLSNATKRVEKSLLGLKVLGDSYQNNPSMGDKTSLQPQIDVNERQLTSLKDMTDATSKYCHTGGGGNAAALAKKPMPPNAAADTNADSDGSFDEDDEEDFDGDADADRGASNLAKVLYDFDSTDAQQLTVVTDMTVKVLNYDDSGSGWTLVQSTKDLSQKGYVPTNYIKMVL